MPSFDVFLSHNSKDKSAVQLLKLKLEKAGVSCWLDEEQLMPGDNVQEGLEIGINNSATAVICLGPSGIGPWQDEEMQALLNRAVREKHRVIPVLLPKAPSDIDIPTFLGNRLWVDLRPKLTKKNLGLLLKGITGNKPISHNPPPPKPRCAHLPGGAVGTDSPLYVERPADGEILSGVQMERALFVLRGPRQVGKTSLILRVKSQVEKSQIPLQTAFVDFESFSEEALSSANQTWCQIAQDVAESIGLDDNPTWGKKSATGNFTDFLEQHVFTNNYAPLLICFDEADRLFTKPFCNEFFGQVRKLYNLAASDKILREVRWLITASCEPTFFIKDLSQSPFNIGRKIELRYFDIRQTQELLKRLDQSMEPTFVEYLLHYLGGQPYLTHWLLYHWTREPERQAEFFNPVQAADSIFQDHLRRFLKQFREEPILAEAMRKIVAGSSCDDMKLTDRLLAAGLAKTGTNGKLIPTCELYRVFFSRVL